MSEGWKIRTAPVVAEQFELFVDTERNADIEALEHGVEPAYARFLERDGQEGWEGVDIVLQSDLSAIPVDDLAKRWRTDTLTTPVIDAAEVIARDVVAARSLHHEMVRIGDVSHHAEVLDLSEATEVERLFFYLHDALHRRRVHMLADVIVAQVSQVVAEKGHARVFEMGAGPCALQRAAVELLPTELRANVEFAVVDVSEDLLRYGASKGWVDTCYLADVTTLDHAGMQKWFGSPDIVIAAEVLEHIETSVNTAGNGVIKWVRDAGGYLLGSVPNAVQGVEIPAMFTGTAASHQLTRHLFDETTEHVAFYSYPTLRRALIESWGASKAWIWGNGLRLVRQGKTLCLDAALAYPHRSDRLCFAASFTEQGINSCR